VSQRDPRFYLELPAGDPRSYLGARPRNPEYYSEFPPLDVGRKPLSSSETESIGTRRKHRERQRINRATEQVQPASSHCLSSGATGITNTLEAVFPVMNWEAKNQLSASLGLRTRGSFEEYFVPEGVQPLPPDLWPKDSLGRKAWPSTPLWCESLDMRARGVTPRPVFVPSGYTCRVKESELERNPFLAQAIVGHNLLGIRSDVALPKSYLAQFSYRWGFLILDCHTPSFAVSRKAIQLWRKEFSSLWLQSSVPLKQYLQRVPLALVNEARARFDPEDAW
jgi:hypothetical protein